MTSTPVPGPVAVTGATGALGGMVARRLAATGASQRLLVRTPAKAPSLLRATVHRMHYGDRASAQAALTGVKVLFMVSGAEAPDRLQQHYRFIDAATAAGVGHVVYTSFAGAAPQATFTLARDHYATEEYLKSSGMAWTMLRDNFYFTLLEALVGDDGVIRGPAGHGRVAAVAHADVAEVAARILQHPAPHAGHAYDLTGPEALTLAEAARILSTVGGRQITYHEETVEEAYTSRQQWNAPGWQLDAWVSTYTAIAAGELAQLSDDVEAVTGRSPLTLAQYLNHGAEYGSGTPDAEVY